MRLAILHVDLERPRELELDRLLDELVTKKLSLHQRAPVIVDPGHRVGRLFEQSLDPVGIRSPGLDQSLRLDRPRAE